MIERAFNGKKVVSALKAGTALPFLIFLCLFLVTIFSRPCGAQWRPIFNWHGQFISIHFLDKEGAPLTGFLGTPLDSIFRTSDGGQTWRRVLLHVDAEGAYDFAFKDSLTGWIGGDYEGANFGAYKTTDGGQTWVFLDGSIGLVRSIYYDKATGGLIEGDGDYWPPLTSWDEGQTWVHGGYSNFGTGGFAFADDYHGTLSPLGVTSDGGKSWTTVSFPFDSAFWQPVAIEGTQTYLGLTWNGNILRTDDTWQTWRVVSQLPLGISTFGGSVCSSTIEGTANNLIAQTGLGCFRSTDTGTTWISLCGPLSDNVAWDRFYVMGNKVYAPTLTWEGGGTLWYLNLDSLNLVTSTFSEQFDNGSKRATIHAGDTVRVDFLSDTALGPAVGVDSVSISISYDNSSLALAYFVPSSGWSIKDSFSAGGYYHLLLVASDTLSLANPNKLLRGVFASYLTIDSLQAKVYLDSIHLYGHRLNCDCPVESVLGVNSASLSSALDSVEIDLTGCRDSLLLAAMQGKLSLVINGIAPNPFSQSTQITFTSWAAGYADISIVNLLGEQVEHIFSGELDAGQHNFTFSNTTDLPDGMYECLVRMNGRVEKVGVALLH